jgi:hypothetical protein
MKKNSVLLSAAIAGIMGAASAFAADTVAPNAAPGKTALPAAARAVDTQGHCMGANACKGKSACATATSGCSGQNACKGKGFTETSKSDCEKAMKKDKKVKFEG